MVSTGVQNLDQILSDGYPERSSILVTGPPGIGKEALGYWFIDSGLVEEDFCFYVTHRPVSDVQRDMKAFGILSDHVPQWMGSSGSEKRCDLNDLPLISSSIKDAVDETKAKRTRIVTDVLSPLLVLNSPDSMYRYFSQLLAAVKEHNAVLIATAEEGMHSESVMTSMEQLFDGVIQFRIYGIGLSLTPLLRVKKMLGLPPLHSYFRFSFAHHCMKITGAFTAESTGKPREVGISNWLMGKGEERRLAAIMFTDIANYSSLSRDNEPLALTLLEEHRDLLRPIFAKHGGREVKTIGDAFLVEFLSALEAVACAIDIQQVLNERNLANALERNIQLRVAVHLGDVEHKDGDVYGDAVNIASRIHDFVDPGEICITEQVFDQMQGGRGFRAAALGKRELKNMRMAMEIYKVLVPERTQEVARSG